jgi:hypothetical protein
MIFLVIGGMLMLFHANSYHHNSYDYDCAAMVAMIATTVVASGYLVVVLQEPHHVQHHSFCSMWW